MFVNLVTPIHGSENDLSTHWLNIVNLVTQTHGSDNDLSTHWLNIVNLVTQTHGSDNDLSTHWLNIVNLVTPIHSSDNDLLRNGSKNRRSISLAMHQEIRLFLPEHQCNVMVKARPFVEQKDFVLKSRDA